MTRIIPALAVLALLAACGADGKPIPPAKPEAKTTSSGTGVTMSGYGRFGAVSGDRAPGGGGGNGGGGGSSGGGY